MNPLVSILIPCHNAVRYVGAALNSAIAQTWENKEIIVVNDGSTDGSDRVLSQFRGHGVQVLTPIPPLRSAAKARNLAFSASNGEYVKFFDADDLMHPELIRSQMDRVAGQVDCVATSEWGRFYQYDASDFRLSPEPVWEDMSGVEWLLMAMEKARPMMQPGIFLIPRQLAIKAGPWWEDLPVNPLDDFEFFCRLISISQMMLFVPRAPLMYRSGLPSSLSNQNSADAKRSTLESLIRGTNHLIQMHPTSRARLVSANMIQQFVYSHYPMFPELRKKATSRVIELGGSSIAPDGPPRFHKLRRIVGWKLARRVQRAFGR